MTEQRPIVDKIGKLTKTSTEKQQKLVLHFLTQLFYILLQFPMITFSRKRHYLSTMPRSRWRPNITLQCSSFPRIFFIYDRPIIEINLFLRLILKNQYYQDLIKSANAIRLQIRQTNDLFFLFSLFFFKTIDFKCAASIEVKYERSEEILIVRSHRWSWLWHCVFLIYCNNLRFLTVF